MSPLALVFIFLFLRSRSASQAGPADEVASQDWEEGGEAEPSQDSYVGMERGDEELLLPSAPLKLPCQEDEDFLSALDKMINENIAESKNIIRDKNSLTVVTAPLTTSKAKKTWEQLQDEGKEDETRVQVMIMLRKGGGGAGKIAKGISVSADSQLGEQFLLRDEREAR